MHLHGFYFRVDSRGDGIADTTYSATERDLVVTERVRPGATTSITWVPERPGNWLFHCHFTSHFSVRGPLGVPTGPPPQDAHARHLGNHALEGMSGLVVGVAVEPRAAGQVSTPESVDEGRRRLRLLVRPSGGTAARPYYAFTLHEGGAEPGVDTTARSGPPIVLRRGEPVSITVVNRAPEPTAIHWHGIELDSYFDGVAGFGGSSRRLAPVIAPSDSFEARFTPPRSGTFIYHTHVDEPRQQPAGLSGALLVVDPNRPYDPATDIPVLISTPRTPDVARRAVLLNGMEAPLTTELRVGVPHRFRLINITIGRPGIRVEVRRDTSFTQWRALAKDGADLPDGQKVMRRAVQPITIGETYDFELTPRGAWGDATGGAVGNWRATRDDAARGQLASRGPTRNDVCVRGRRPVRHVRRPPSRRRRRPATLSRATGDSGSHPRNSTRPRSSSASRARRAARSHGARAARASLCDTGERTGAIARPSTAPPSRP